MRGLLREAMQGTALRVSMVVWTFGYLLVSITAASQNRSEFVEMLVASTPLWLLGLAQSTLLGVVFERLFSLSLIQRWALAVSAALLAGLVQTAADLFWLRLLASVLRPEWVWAFSLDPQRVMIVFMLYTWSMLMLLGLNWAARSGDIAKLNEARAAAFEAAATRAEIAALRWQLNPHFLFNTLNGIASLVVRGQQERAEDMIERLAQFLRSSLASNPTDLVPLEQEMATIRAYLHIEEARFEDRATLEPAKILTEDGLLSHGGIEDAALLMANHRGLCEDRFFQSGEKGFDAHLKEMRRWVKKAGDAPAGITSPRDIPEASKPIFRKILAWLEHRCGTRMGPASCCRRR